MLCLLILDDPEMPSPPIHDRPPVSDGRKFFIEIVFKCCCAVASWNSGPRPARHGYGNDELHSVLEPSFKRHCPGSRLGSGSGLLIATTIMAACGDRVSRRTFLAVLRAVCSCSIPHPVDGENHELGAFTATAMTCGLQIKPLILSPVLLSMSPSARETWRWPST